MELQESRTGWLVSVGQGLAWLVTAAGAIVDAIYIREALLDILVWYRSQSLIAFREAGGVGHDLGTTFRMTAIDFFAIFFLAGLLVVAIVWMEYYYRRGRSKGLLWKRVLKVAGIEVAIVLVSILTQVLI